MPLALPVVAVGLLALVIALILTVLVTPYVEAAASEIPVIGGYIARATKRVVDVGTHKVKVWAQTFVGGVVAWLLGLQDAAKELAESAATFAVETVAKLDHLTHVTVHEIVHAFVNPVRDLAHDAQQTATQAQAGVDVLARELGDEIHSIDGTLHREIGQLADAIRTVDLPALGRQLGQVIGEVEHDTVGRLGDLRHYSDAEFARLWDRLDRIPLQQILEGLAAAGAAAVLVNVIADEAGLGRAECRGKVKNICATDPRAWESLLAGVIPLLALPSLPALVEAAQYVVGLALPTIEQLARAGGADG